MLVTLKRCLRSSLRRCRTARWRSSSVRSGGAAGAWNRSRGSSPRRMNPAPACVRWQRVTTFLRACCIAGGARCVRVGSLRDRRRGLCLCAWRMRPSLLRWRHRRPKICPARRRSRSSCRTAAACVLAMLSAQRCCAAWWRRCVDDRAAAWRACLAGVRLHRHAKASTVWRLWRSTSSARTPSAVSCSPSAAGAGVVRHSASFRSKPRQPERLISLQNAVVSRAAIDDRLDASPDGVRGKCGDRYLPRRGWRKLRGGKNLVAYQFVN